MRMMPPKIADSTRSSAERRLFDALSKVSLPDNYYCLHSLDLPEHLYKVCGELDFVIIGPTGLYVIEVKGGQISYRSGIWHYLSRKGYEAHNSEGPFKQALSGMYSLRDRLQQKLPKGALASLVTGWGVAFPDCNFDISSVEWDEALVLDSKLLATQGLLAYLRQLEAYWHSKYPSRPSSVSDDLVKQIVRLMRPDFELVRSLYAHVNEVEERLERLTEEQYNILDIVEPSARILIEGGAGTGKTFLALEVARREADKGQRVLLVCFSPVLAAFLSTRIINPGVTIKSVHQLMIEVVRKYDTLPDDYRSYRPLTDSWFIERLVPIFDAAAGCLPDSLRYDVLVIDEAHDILNLEYLVALGHMLRGGVDKGKWRIFYDRFNQGAIFGAMDPEVLEMLRADETIFAGRLGINCRNTNEIVLQTKLATGADLGNRSTGPGPQVIYKIYRDENEAAQQLEAYLESLKKQQIDSRDITILSPLPYEQSSANRMSETWRRRITQLGISSSLSFPFAGLTFSTVADFKGLENSYIAMTDINDLNSTDAARAILYVGMSRARASLWVAMNRKLRQQQEEIARQHLPKVLEDLRRDR